MRLTRWLHRPIACPNIIRHSSRRRTGPEYFNRHILFLRRDWSAISCAGLACEWRTVTTTLEDPDDRYAPGAKAPEGPRAIAAAALLAALEAVAGTAGAAEKLAPLFGKDAETVIISILDSRRAGSGLYELKAAIRNLTAHGLYVEDFRLEPNESRQGPEPGAAQFRISGPGKISVGIQTPHDPAAAAFAPVRIEPGKSETFTVQIDLTAGTWPAIHHSGKVAIRVTELGKPDPPVTKRQAFGIRT